MTSTAHFSPLCWALDRFWADEPSGGCAREREVSYLLVLLPRCDMRSLATTPTGSSGAQATGHRPTCCSPSLASSGRTSPHLLSAAAVEERLRCGCGCGRQRGEPPAGPPAGRGERSQGFGSKPRGSGGHREGKSAPTCRYTHHPPRARSSARDGLLRL